MAPPTEQELIDSHNTTTSASTNPDVPQNRKRFVPLENNPDVMNSLIHKLGLSPNLAFQDVFSIDDPDLLSFIPRPAHALLLIFPVSDTYEKFRRDEDGPRDEYTGKGDSEPVVWYRQTIGNACGLMGLLHAVSNGEAKKHVTKDSELDKFIMQAIPLSPTDRAQLLYDSHAMESATQAAGAEGDTSAPEADASVDLHYVCFVKADDGHLWEMDGRRKGPLDRGQLGEEDDVLSEEALRLGVRAFLKREEQAGGGDLRFSLICLTTSMD